MGGTPSTRSWALAPGRLQLDVQQAAVTLVTEVPYAEAQTLFGNLTGVGMGTERMHTLTNHVAEGLTVVDVAPSRERLSGALLRWRRATVVQWWCWGWV